LKSSGSEQSIATQQAKADCSTGCVPEENAKGMVRNLEVLHTGISNCHSLELQDYGNYVSYNNDMPKKIQ
jgi:hypothetical protein